MKMTQKDIIIFCILGMILFAVSNITTFFSYTPIGIDEMAYVAQAELIAGNEWSDVMQGMTYHSFGSALIPGVILKIFGSNAFSYKIILLVNSVLLLIGFYYLVKIQQILFPSVDNNKIIVIAFAAMIYPSNIVYSNSLLAENYVTLAYILISFLMVKYIEKQRIIDACLISILMIWELSIHQRTLGILIAAVVLVVFVSVKNKKYWQLFAFFGTLAICIIVFKEYKTFSKNIIWQNSVVADENDFSSVINTSIFYRFTLPEFWKGIVLLSISRMWYFLVASFGIVFFGMRHLIKMLKMKDTKLTLIATFWLLSSILCWGITLFNGFVPASIYHVVMGRYMDALVFPFLMLGLVWILNNEFQQKTIRFLILIIFLFTKITSLYSDYVAIDRGRYYSLEDSAGIYLFSKNSYSNGQFWIIALCILGAMIIFYFCVKKKNYLICFSLLLLFFISNSVMYSSRQIEKHKENYNSICILSKNMDNNQTIDYLPGSYCECRYKYMFPKLDFNRVDAKSVKENSYIECLIIPSDKYNLLELFEYEEYYSNDIYALIKKGDYR